MFFLGILYQLKKPYYVLKSLAKATRFPLVSTRIAQYTPNMKTRIAEAPVGYLFHGTELNNDATNFWIFFDAGLKRIHDRTSWDILDYVRVGNLPKSDLASPNGDERAFALVKSRYFWQDAPWQGPRTIRRTAKRLLQLPSSSPLSRTSRAIPSAECNTH
jgi:tRNA (mo5U34)-methyltransferase